MDCGEDYQVSFGSVLIYMGLLGFGAVISPGVGFFGRLVAMLPQPVTELSHAPAYGLLTWLLTGGFQGHGWRHRSALFMAMAIALIFGIWMEILQGFVPGRVVDSGDVLVNAIGIGMAALLILWRGMSAGSDGQFMPACSCTHVD
jgi:VanZ like protein